ncbi:MAG TPA: biotin--[acetyl-CoA-carboxylase] ligase [Bacteroidota bacterium]|nr:biotin--[acetyl-CoA-carboxylase] ligase [Bacteroidota bacterium]
MLTKKQLLKGLSSRVIGKKIFVFDKIDSTNACAKILAEAGIEDGSIVIADYQTEGRGRQGRSWQSEIGKNLLFSLVLKSQLHRTVVGLLPFYAAVSVARGIESMLPITVHCKWPNDVIIQGKKCCGILLESAVGTETLRYAVVGIGVNVNQERFPGEMTTPPTSLKLEVGKSIDRVALFQHIVHSLDELYPKIQQGDFTDVVTEWQERTPMLGKEISIVHHGKTVQGVAKHINVNGGLVVATPEGTKTFYAGDVSVFSNNDGE